MYPAAFSKTYIATVNESLTDLYLFRSLWESMVEKIENSICTSQDL